MNTNNDNKLSKSHLQINNNSKKNHTKKNMNIQEDNIQQRIAFMIHNGSSQSLKESIKIFIFELQITVLIVNIVYNDIINLAHTDNFTTLPHIICNMLSFNFIIMPNEKDIIFRMKILIMIMMGLGLYFLISFFSIITIIFYKNKHIKSAKFRLNWMKFVISYHIPITSFLFFTLCMQSIQSIKNAHTGSLVQNATIWLIIPFIFISILNILLCLFILQYTTHALFNDHMNGKRSNLDLWLIITFRLGLAISLIITNDDIKIWYSIILITTFLFIRAWEIFLFPCYYSLKLNKIFGVFYGIKLSIVITGIIYYFIDEIPSNQKYIQMTCLILIICPVISKFILTFLEFAHDRRLRRKTGKILTIDQVLTRFVYFSHIFTNYISCNEKSINKRNIILKGKLVIHLNECENCPIKQDINTFLELPVEKNFEILGKIKIHILGNLLTDAIQIYPNAFELSLLFIELIMDDDTKTFHKGFLLLQKIPINKLASYELLAYYLLKLKFKKKIIEINENKYLNIEPLLISQDFETNLINEIIFQSKKHIQWWEIIKDSNHLELEKIVSLAKKIDKDSKSLEYIWKRQEFTYNANLYTKPYLIYSGFLEIIKDNTTYSKFILKKYTQIKTRLNYYDKIDKIVQANITSEKNAAIKISIHKNQLGDITYCSNSIRQLLGYTKQEINARKKIETIMPQFYQALHKQFIMNYFNTGKSKVFNTMVNVFTQHKEGYIVPTSLSVALIPDATEGTSLIGLMRKRNMSDDTILVSLDGHIIGLTKEIMMKWGIRSSDLSGIMIWNICPGFKKVLSAFQLVLQNEYGINSPKNIKNISNYDRWDEYLELNEGDKEENLPFKQAEKLTKKYQEEGIILEYGLSMNKSILSIRELQLPSLLEPYLTKITKEVYLNNIWILQLTIKKLNLNEKVTLKFNASKSPPSIYSVLKNLSLNNTSNHSSNHDECPSVLNRMQSYGLIINASKKIHSNKLPLKISFTNPDNTINIEDKDEFYQPRSPYLLSKSNLDKTNLSKKLKNVSFANFEVTSIKDKKKYKININEQKLKKSDGEKEQENNSSYYSKSSMNKQNHDKIQKALEVSFKPKVLSFQLSLIPLILILSVILIILVEEKGKEVAIQANNYVNVIRTANQRSLNLLELYHTAKILWMTKTNLLTYTEQCNIECEYFPSLTSHISIEAAGIFLVGNSTSLAQSIMPFDSVMQQIFYNDEVELYEVDPNSFNNTLIPSSMKVDQFKAIDIIYKKCIELVEISFQDVTENITQLTYILNNTINDLGFKLEITNNKIANEMNSIIRTVKDFLLNIIIILIPIGLLIWTVIFMNIIYFYNQNRKILEIIIRLSKQCFDPQILKINYFINQLINETYDNFLIKKKKSNKLQDNSSSTSPKEYRASSYIIKSNKYFFRFVIKAFILLIIIIYILLSFELRYIYRTKRNQDRIIALDSIIESINQLYYQRLSLDCLYEYIASNKTSIAMNQPISLAFNSAIEKISSPNDFIEAFLFLDHNYDPIFEYILYGNACTLLPPSFPFLNQCTKVGGGPAQRGLIGLNTYISQSILTAKLDFENSTYSKDDMIRSINLACIKDVEVISATITSYFYTYLYELLYSKFKIASETITNSGTIWIEVSVIIAILTVLVVWLPIYLLLLSEIDNIKKVLKILPKDAILSNKILKKYIMYTSSSDIINKIDD